MRGLVPRIRVFLICFVGSVRPPAIWRGPLGVRHRLSHLHLQSLHVATDVTKLVSPPEPEGPQSGVRDASYCFTMGADFGGAPAAADTDRISA